MKYRQLRVISTGQWIDVLFTVQAKDGQPDVFTVPAESHQVDIARALNVPPAGLEVVDADLDIRTGALLDLPPPPPVPQTLTQQRISELLAVPRSDWTTAQMRELLQLVAQGAYQ